MTTNPGETVVRISARLNSLNHDKRQLTLQVEDLRTQLYTALDMAQDANRNASNLSREYGMAIREIHSLEGELEEAHRERDQALARLQEIGENE